MATLAETAQVLKRLAAAYGQTITADQAKAYQGVVGLYPRMDLALAATDLMGENTFFPRPAELRAKLQERKIKGLVFYCKHSEDEATFWRMFELGITNVDDLSEEDVRKVYGAVELFDMAVAA